jgi:hypothetical protein
LKFAASLHGRARRAWAPGSLVALLRGHTSVLIAMAAKHKKKPTKAGGGTPPLPIAAVTVAAVTVAAVAVGGAVWWARQATASKSATHHRTKA